MWQGQQARAHAAELITDFGRDHIDRDDLVGLLQQIKFGQPGLGFDLPAAHLVGRAALVDDTSLLALT